MLVLDHLNVHLGSRRWSFNLKLQSHGVYALLGRSGSGKSTLLNAVAGFIAADAGKLLWHGQSLLGLDPASRPITTLFQEHNLFSHLSVMQNIGLGISPNLRLNDKMRADIHTVLQRVGLPGYEEKRPGALSGGEQQRAALARCFLRRQPILLLDEPFSALDTTTRQEMIDLLQELIDSFKPCVVMVTHDEADAAALNARTLLMSENAVHQLNDPR